MKNWVGFTGNWPIGGQIAEKSDVEDGVVVNITNTALLELFDRALATGAGAQGFVSHELRHTPRWPL